MSVYLLCIHAHVQQFHKYISNAKMQSYLRVQSVLTSASATYADFESALLAQRIDQEIYLNLFLTLVVLNKNRNQHFVKFIELLTHFGEKTGKKSADINYLGYKDKISILMQACQKTNAKTVQTLLSFTNLDLLAEDPLGKNACFYAIKHENQMEATLILASLFDRNSKLIFSDAGKGYSLLFQAIQLMKVSICQFLLKCGLNPNQKLLSNGNTPLHQIIRQSDQLKKDVSFRLILLLFRFKANFSQINNQGLTVFQYARLNGISVEEITSSRLPFKQEMSAEECSQFQNDKQSLQSLYQQTKFGDSTSQGYDIQSSNIFSQHAERDFSQGEWTEKYSLQDDLQQVNISCPNSDNESNQSEQESEQELFLEYDKINFPLLTSEIMEFSAQCDSNYLQSLQQIQPFLNKLSQIIQNYDLTLELVGSFATGLWFPYSDIDLAMTFHGQTFLNFERTLQKIYKKLKHRKGQLGITNVIFSKGSKINSIKLDMNESYGSRRLDLSIFHKKNMSRVYAMYINAQLKEHLEIKPLFFALKRICQTLNLHDQSTGGLKTYALFLMILMVIKSYPNKSLGQLIYHIALYYGFYFEYDYEEVKMGDVVRAENTFKTENLPKIQNPVDTQQNKELEVIQCSKMRLNLLDPLNSKNNVGGKNTKIEEVQHMFRSMYYTLHKNIKSDILGELFQLHLII